MGAATGKCRPTGCSSRPGSSTSTCHYDGQATWDNRLLPSAWHGVTTVVMGNCGVGFAPVQPADHDRLIELMEGVEDIPGAVLHEGLDWSWQTFGQYLDAIDGRPRDIDLAAQVPHAALRLYVMGERGADTEPPTADEIATMGRLAVARRPGRRARVHDVAHEEPPLERGEPTPTLTATHDELVGIAAALGQPAPVCSRSCRTSSTSTTKKVLLRDMAATGRPLVDLPGRRVAWRQPLRGCWPPSTR